MACRMSAAPSILLVEDDQDVAEALAEVLRDAGYHLVVDTDAATALARLASGYRPAAMLIDLTLRGLSGAELLRACATDPALAQIPAIATSALHPEDSALPSLHAYLQKPFTPDELLLVLERVVPRGRP
jgi:CheY-like chemotaxis protein